MWAPRCAGIVRYIARIVRIQVRHRGNCCGTKEDQGCKFVWDHLRVSLLKGLCTSEYESWVAEGILRCRISLAVSYHVSVGTLERRMGRGSLTPLVCEFANQLAKGSGRMATPSPTCTGPL